MRSSLDLLCFGEGQLGLKSSVERMCQGFAFKKTRPLVEGKKQSDLSLVVDSGGQE